MRTFRKQLSLLMAALCFIGLSICVSPDVVAADTVTYAGEFGVTYTVEGATSPVEYQITLPESGRLDITFDGHAYVYLYDENGQNIGTRNVYKPTEITYHLTAGNYIVRLSLDSSSYTLLLDYTPSEESFHEEYDGSNNSIATASGIDLNTEYKGQIAHNDSVDYYEFTITESGFVNLQMSSEMTRMEFYVYDEDGEKLWSDASTVNSFTGKLTYDDGLYLTAGTYYLKVPYLYEYFNYGNYTFQLGLTPSAESFSETNGGSNNSMNTASSIGLSKEYTGLLAENDTADYYKFVLDKSGKVSLSSTAYIELLSYSVVNEAGVTLWTDTVSWESSTAKAEEEKNLELTSGTYYLVVEQYDSGYTGEYSFKLSFESANETFAEVNGGSNNSEKYANEISLYTTYKGQIAINDEDDYYKFTVMEDTTLILSVETTMTKLLYESPNSSGYMTSKYISSDGQGTSVSEVELSEGTYYIHFEVISGYYGNYSFKLSLPAPTISSISNTTSGVKLTWDAIGSSDKYVVQRKTSGGSWTKLTTTSSTSYTDKTAKSGTKYYYRVRCVNSSGSSLSDYSSSSSIQYLKAGVVSKLTNTTSGIKVQWSKVTGASGYYIYRKAGSGSYSQVKKITSVSTTSWTDSSSLKSGTTYTYKVVPYSSSAKGAFTAKSIRYLSTGTISSLTNVTSGVTVKWSKVTGASGYYVYRKTSSGSYSKVKTVSGASTVSWTDTKVKSKNGTTYIYYVQPYYKSGSTETLGAYKTKTTVRLIATSISSVKNSSSKKATVKWTKKSSVTGYEIQYSTSKSFSSKTTKTVSGASKSSYTLSSLKTGKTYYVRIRTYKTVSGKKYYSAWSSTKSVAIKK